jgi:DNA-binding response OmpR family regulator
VKQTILIIEDDRNLNDGIKFALRSEYYCLQADTIETARKYCTEDAVNLVLLDVNLPDGSGFDFLQELRQQTQMPVIILTANKMEMDVVRGLEMGANDYVTKPFGLAELRARVAVQLRSISSKCAVYEVGDYSFDFDKMIFTHNHQVIELSKTEQRLLRKLVEHTGMCLSRVQLVDEVWQGDNEFVDSHALSVVVNRLRKKLGDEGQMHLKTVYGIGYSWVE